MSNRTHALTLALLLVIGCFRKVEEVDSSVLKPAQQASMDAERAKIDAIFESKIAAQRDADTAPATSLVAALNSGDRDASPLPTNGPACGTNDTTAMKAYNQQTRDPLKVIVLNNGNDLLTNDWIGCYSDEPCNIVGEIYKSRVGGLLIVIKYKQVDDIDKIVGILCLGRDE